MNNTRRGEVIKRNMSIEDLPFGKGQEPLSQRCSHPRRTCTLRPTLQPWGARLKRVTTAKAKTHRSESALGVFQVFLDLEQVSGLKQFVKPQDCLYASIHDFSAVDSRQHHGLVHLKEVKELRQRILSASLDGKISPPALAWKFLTRAISHHF